VDTGRGNFFNEVTLVGGYEAVGASGGEGFTLCRSELAGGYSAAALSWGGQGLQIAGSSASACVEGVSGSWGSSDIDVTGNVIYGGGRAVATSWGTTEVNVEDNLLQSDGAAVHIQIAGNPSTSEDPMNPELPADFATTVCNNVIAAGSMPSSSAQHGILVEDNEAL